MAVAVPGKRPQLSAFILRPPRPPNPFNRKHRQAERRRDSVVHFLATDGQFT